MRDMDVTAVVLTIGEPFLARALASLERQSLPPAEVVVVEHVTPFHRALNAGIARVRTELFVQVDADMVLDPTAFADLRACAAPDIGAVIGGLRDPLRGSIVGVKLYRTAAAAMAVPDSITPAVDFLQAMLADGWLTAHALAYRPGPPALWHTFGEHAPDYSPLYTFAKFRILGARYRHQRHGPSLRRMFDLLQRSGHPAAPMAQAAAALGVFWEQGRDALQPAAANDELARCQRLLDAVTTQPISTSLNGSGPRQAFIDQYRIGCGLVGDHAAAEFRGRFDALAAAGTLAGWTGLIGLCRAVAEPRFDAARAAADFDALASLFPDGLDA